MTDSDTTGSNENQEDEPKPGSNPPDKPKIDKPESSEQPENDSIYPLVPMSSGTEGKAILSVMVNPSVMEALAQDSPEQLLEFVEKSDDRQYQYYLQKEQNRHNEKIARENTTRIAIASVLSAVFAAFFYSAATGEISLSAEIISALIGGFGGLGIGKVLQRPEDDD